MRDLGVCEAVKIEVRRKLAEGGVKVHRLSFREIDEDEAVEDAHVAAMQAVVRFREIHRHQPRGEQGAVEPVGPGMVGAGQARDAAVGLGADHRAAVAADIVEGIDGRLVAAHDDDRFRRRS